MCSEDHKKVKKDKYNFNVYLSGRKYVNGSYTNTNITGSNTNGDFQLILPNNVPQGRYNISVRSFQVVAANENNAVTIFKLYLDNLAMVNGYNNNNQSNNQLFGLFPAIQVTYAEATFGYDCEYHSGGKLPKTQQVSGIQSLQNGLIKIRITNENDVPITIPGTTLTGGNWHLQLDFEYLGE